MCLVGEQMKISTTCNIYIRGGCLCTPHWMWLHHEYSSTNSKPIITDILTPHSVTFLLQNMVVEDVGKSCTCTTSVSHTHLHQPPSKVLTCWLVQFVYFFFWCFFGGPLRFCQNELGDSGTSTAWAPSRAHLHPSPQHPQHPQPPGLGDLLRNFTNFAY